MDVMGVLPPIVARIVKRFKCLNTERERGGVMEKILERERCWRRNIRIYASLYTSKE